jgi:hypothetical protein
VLELEALTELARNGNGRIYIGLDKLAEVQPTPSKTWTDLRFAEAAAVSHFFCFRLWSVMRLPSGSPRTTIRQEGKS